MSATSTQEPGPKPTFQVVETNLHYRTKKGEEIVLDIDIPFGVLVDVAAGDQNEQQQFVALLEALGDTETLDKVKALGSIEAMALIMRFFEEFERLVGASVGESRRSSTS
jgi:hypothetical protein